MPYIDNMVLKKAIKGFLGYHPWAFKFNENPIIPWF
jgi:hypothetical protein